MTFRASRLSVDWYERGIIEGDLGTLARAVTLVESRSEEDRQTRPQPPAAGLAAYGPRASHWHHRRARCREKHVHRQSRHAPARCWLSRSGARDRSDEPALGGVNSRRQDAHAAARARSARVCKALPERVVARRRGAPHTRDDVTL